MMQPMLPRRPADAERPVRLLQRPSVRVALMMALLGLTGCQMVVLDPGGPIGLANKTILLDSLGIMLAIVIPTVMATLAFA